MPAFPATLGQTLVAKEGLETWRLHATHWWMNRHASFASVNSAMNIFKWDVMSSFPSKLLKHMVETFPPLLESGLSIGKSSRVLQQITSRQLKVLLPMLPLQMLLFETPPGCLLHVGLNGEFTPRTFPPKIDRRFGKNWKVFERIGPR